MKNVTVRMPDEKVEELDAEADERDMSRAKYIRSIIESRHGSDVSEDELERLRESRDELKREVERVQREKRQILDQREEHTELVKAVQSERTIAERKAQAGIATRSKWWLTGMPDDED